MIDQTSHRQFSSIRKSCRVLGLDRQQYYNRKKGNRTETYDDELRGLLHQITKRFIAWGFWKVFHYLRLQGYPWNHKRVYRVWKEEHLHLRLPPQRKKIRRTYQELLSPDSINEGWAMDFVSDWVVGPEKKSIRVINIMDEGSRKALWTTAHHSISAKTLVEVLDKILIWRGAPRYIRCDNGPEFISYRLKEWADENGIEIKFSQPGKPAQNGLIERLNKTLRTECLNLNWFASLPQLNADLQQWWSDYNSCRPHENIGNITPDMYEMENKNFYYSAVG
ncbi:MAG: IS3 family transposase [Bacteroidota bacterium]